MPQKMPSKNISFIKISHSISRPFLTLNNKKSLLHALTKTKNVQKFIFKKFLSGFWRLKGEGIIEVHFYIYTLMT